MESGLLELGNKPRMTRSRRAVDGLLWASRAAGGAAVGVASCRRCCYGRHELSAMLLWASRAADGVAVALWASWAAAGLLWGSRLLSRLLWASRLPGNLLSCGCRSWRRPEEEGLEAAGFNFAYISNKNDVVWCFKKNK